MSESIEFNKTNVKALRGDLTDLDVESIVFYARTNLALGSGYGNAISTRGGPSITKELVEIGSIEKFDAVISGAGELKANYIIHSAGPVFQEENLEAKLRKTIDNTLKRADEKGISQIAFPIMGSGFYGVLPERSLDIMFESIKDYTANDTGIKEIIICGNDNREFRFIKSKFDNL